MNRPHTEVILDSIADGVFTVDLDWNITSFNRAAEEITGVAREQAIGQKCFDVFRADICQTACTLRQTIETGEPIVDRRVTILDSTGRSVRVSISTAVLRDAQGRVVGGVETFRDLSPIESLRREIRRTYTLQDIISKNHRVQRIFQVLPDIAASDSTVLIEGPSGSGKELFARAIHNLSGRRAGHYVAVNCGALPDTLLESELFGYRRGAFTDAKRDKPGRLARAEGGTLFLDEIADISTALQVKLLRVLQEREYEPLGATAPVKADVRVIAATNQVLAEAVARGRFREDLFYRLNVVRIELPPLRDRREDIPLLCEHFLERLRARMGKPITGITDEALEALMQHNFPGNIRELENALEHAFILCRGTTIEREHLPANIVAAGGAPGPSQARAARPAEDAAAEPSAETPGEGLPRRTDPRLEGMRPLARAEAETLLAALERHGGSRTAAAAELGIHPSTLWRRMKKLGL